MKESQLRGAVQNNTFLQINTTVQRNLANLGEEKQKANVILNVEDSVELYFSSKASITGRTLQQIGECYSTRSQSGTQACLHAGTLSRFLLGGQTRGKSSVANLLTIDQRNLQPEFIILEHPFELDRWKLKMRTSSQHRSVSSFMQCDGRRLSPDSSDVRRMPLSSQLKFTPELIS